MIHLVMIIRMALRSLAAHKFRSFLSVVGIIFGVMAVVAMLAVGEGAKREQLRQIELLGANNLVVRAVKLTLAEQMAAEQRQSRGLTLDDASALSSLPGVAGVAALSEVVVESTRRPDTAKPAVVGTTPEYAHITNLHVGEGRFIAEHDLLTRARVCVLGAAAARALAGRPAVGDSIPLGDDWFRVVGVLADKDYSGSDQAAITPRNSNNDIYVPIWAMPGSRSGGAALDELWVQAEDDTPVTALSCVVRGVLDRRHRGVNDFEVLVPVELLAQKQRTLRVFNLVLVCIAGISLLVGGIGIMNIMLATVSERTREIGICRALGACRSDIVIQFLAEAVMLTALGGVLGIVFGWIGAGVIGAVAGWATAVSVRSVLAAAVISALVGIFFGLYPARRAAQMDPIAALRFE